MNKKDGYHAMRHISSGVSNGQIIHGDPRSYMLKMFGYFGYLY